MTRKLSSWARATPAMHRSLYTDDDIVRVVDAHIDLEHLLNMASAGTLLDCHVQGL